MPQELRLPVHGDELGLLTALENIKINKSSVEEIKQVLRLTLIKIGLRSQNWPSDEEKLVLIEHIIKNYGTHTCEEIKLAFDMAIAGRLDVEVNCYENFSCLYFSNIMNAYRSWANEAYRHLPEKNNIEIENVSRETSDEEMEGWISDWRKEVKTLINPSLIPPFFYSWLEKKGKLELSKDQKHEYMEQAVSVRQFNLSEQAKSEGVHGEGQKTLNEFNLMRNDGIFKGYEVERLKEMAKKIAVFDYLKKSVA